MKNITVNAKKNLVDTGLIIPDGQNCTLLAAKDGPMTLQEIGSIFNVTRNENMPDRKENTFKNRVYDRFS